MGGEKFFFEEPEERYSRARESAQNFLIMQLGLSMVQWDTTKECYTCSTFSFDIFPRPYMGSDMRFLCQASSLDFLKRHNFDFNRFIYYGIPFLRLDVFAKEKQNLAPRRRDRDPIVLSRPEDIDFVQRQLEKVTEWITSTQPVSISPPNQKRRKFEHIVENESCAEDKDEGEGQKLAEATDSLNVDVKEVPVITLDASNGFLRAALYQELEKKFGTSDFYTNRVKVGDGNDFALQLTRATKESVLLHEAELVEERERKFQESAGFAVVVDALIQSGKPLIGHNMYLDLTYFYQQFVRPLPETFDEFREKLIQLFPAGIYDTKHVAKQFPKIFGLSGTSLETVYKAVTQSCLEKKSRCHEEMKDFGDGNGGEDECLKADGKSDTHEELGKRNVLSYDLSAGVAESESSGESVSVRVPFVVHADGFDLYKGQSMAHNAGYDAFMTGAAFAGLIHLLQARNSVKETEDTFSDMDAYKAFRHRINLMNSLMTYLPLEGPIVLPDTSNVFLLFDFKPETKTSDLFLLFESLGLGCVAIAWRDQTSAFATLEDMSRSHLAISVLEESSWLGKCVALSETKKKAE